MGSKVVNLLVLGLLMVAAVGSCLTGACLQQGMFIMNMMTRER